jgi:hypothetical protein
VVRLALALLLVAVGLPICLQVLLDITGERRHIPEEALPMACGLAAGLLVIFLKRPNWLLHTLVHEACHGLACLLLGVKVHRVMASDGSGGVVEHAHVGRVRTALIALAPYTIPLLLAPLLIGRWLAPEGSYRSALSAVAVTAYVTHLTALVHNIRLNFRDPKGDLAQVGRPLALVAIVCALILVTAVTIVVLWR